MVKNGCFVGELAFHGKVFKLMTRCTGNIDHRCATLPLQVEPIAVRALFGCSAKLGLGALPGARGGSTSAHIVLASSKVYLEIGT